MGRYRRIYEETVCIAIVPPDDASDADGAATSGEVRGCHGADGTKVIAAMGVPAISTAAVKAKGDAGLTAIVTKVSETKRPAAMGANQGTAPKDNGSPSQR